MIYLIIKTPINHFIYSNIPSFIFAFVLALLSSLLISKLAKKLFKNLVNKLDFYDYLHNRYVIDSLIYLVINYSFSPLYIHSLSLLTPI